MSATAPPRPIDPFATPAGGGYADDAVIVRRRPGLDGASGEQIHAHTAHFAIGRDQGRLLLLHDLPDRLLNNDLTALISTELFDPGWAAGADTFERLMTGVVLSCRAEPIDAWECFYRNTLARLDELVAQSGSVRSDRSGRSGRSGRSEGHGSVHGTLSEFAPVYAQAEALISEARTRVLADLGSCFGFLPLRVAGAGVEVVASDLSAGTCRLLERMAARLGLTVQVLSCDAASVPLEDRAADTVTVIHLLEHVNHGQGDRILRQATRLARHRVIIAVPLESQPDPAFGHLRVLTLPTLSDCAARVAPGWSARVFEHHGGWLVLDRGRHR